MISFDYISFHMIIYLLFISFFMLLILRGELEETLHPLHQVDSMAF